MWHAVEELEFLCYFLVATATRLYQHFDRLIARLVATATRLYQHLDRLIARLVIHTNLESVTRTDLFANLKPGKSQE